MANRVSAHVVPAGTISTYTNIPVPQGDATAPPYDPAVPFHTMGTTNPSRHEHPPVAVSVAYSRAGIMLGHTLSRTRPITRPMQQAAP